MNNGDLTAVSRHLCTQAQTVVHTQLTPWVQIKTLYNSVKLLGQGSCCRKEGCGTGLTMTVLTITAQFSTSSVAVAETQPIPLINPSSTKGYMVLIFASWGFNHDRETVTSPCVLWNVWTGSFFSPHRNSSGAYSPPSAVHIEMQTRQNLFIKLLDKHYRWDWSPRAWLLLDKLGSDDRKKECSGRPYLRAPGGCDGKWNVRRGKRK